MQLSRAARIALFIAIAYVGSFSLVAVFSALGGTAPSPEARALWMLYVFPPTFAALIVQGPLSKQPILGPFGLHVSKNRWFLVAWLLPLAVLGGALAAAAAVPGMGLAALGAGPTARLVLYALPAGLVNGLLALAEELGFRGFLYNEVKGGLARRSIVIGLIWGLWLVPLALLGFLHPGGSPAASAAITLAWALVLSPTLILLRQKSGSVVAVALFRGTLIALWPVADHLVTGGGPLERPIYGLTGLAGGLFALALLAALAARAAGRSQRAGGESTEDVSSSSS